MPIRSPRPFAGRICEGELIQAIGRGRGVNRTAETPLDIDLLTDVVLPLTVHEVLPWSAIKPSRRDLMALEGVVLENAADMAACFPALWPSAEAARQDRQRSVTNCYYRDLYNSKMSHSSAEVTYQPTGAGQRARTARFDTSFIRDPESWLAKRLGPLARCDLILRSHDLDAEVDEVKGEASSIASDGDLGIKGRHEHAAPETPPTPHAPCSSDIQALVHGLPHLTSLRAGPSNAPSKNPAADQQASPLLHARDVPHRPPTQEISS